jgi:hypothetical protein
MLVWDWKAWLGPHLQELQGFKDFRAFWFHLDQNGAPIIMYKNNILETTWLGFEGSLREAKASKMSSRVNQARNSTS